MHTFIFILLSCLTLLSTAGEQYGPYKTKLIRVVDGDTFDVKLHIYPGQINTTRLRLAIYNTPELKAKTKCERELAKKATEFTVEFLAHGMIKTTITGIGNFGRPLAIITANGKDLGTALLNAGLARLYQARKSDRKKWCED